MCSKFHNNSSPPDTLKNSIEIQKLITTDSIVQTTASSALILNISQKSDINGSSLKMSTDYEIDALMNELLKDIGNETNMDVLLTKILKNISKFLNCDRCSLFLIEGDSKDDGCSLFRKIFDVNPKSSTSTSSLKVKLPWGVGIIGQVAMTGSTINLEDAYSDPRFNPDIDIQTGYKTKSVLCMPIINNNGKIIGVAELLNKINCDGNIVCFSHLDEKILEKYLVFGGIVIVNVSLMETYVKEIDQNKILLQFAKTIFEEQDSVKHMIDRILEEVVKLIKSQSCSLYLYESDDVNTGISGSYTIETTAAPSEGTKWQHAHDIDTWRKALVDFTLSSGTTVNISNAKTQIPKIIDLHSGGREIPQWGEDVFSDFVTMLYVCVKNKDGKGIGVIEIVNKQNGEGFDEWDVKLFEAVGLFCGIAIVNTKMHEDLKRAYNSQLVSFEVLSYHAGVSDDDVIHLVEMNVPSTEQLTIDQFEFDDVHITDIETCLGVIRIFIDLNFNDHFRIDYITLCRWILTVKKNYRQVPYHNWRHAFNITQFMYCFIKKTDVGRCLTEINKFSLIVACLCHDLDHRGFNNSYFHKTKMPLSQLYSTSTMEYHHYEQAQMILKFPGNEINKNLSVEENKEFHDSLQHAIISTDLLLYFSRQSELNALITEKSAETVRESITHDVETKKLIMSMLMTACDLSGLTKEWNVQKRIAHLVTEEFFHQGDIEREMLKEPPIEMMDREKLNEAPRLQVHFITTICHPLYQSLARLWPQLEILAQRVAENRNVWQHTQF